MNLSDHKLGSQKATLISLAPCTCVATNDDLSDKLETLTFRVLKEFKGSIIHQCVPTK